jgi:hypothetical protein
MRAGLGAISGLHVKVDLIPVLSIEFERLDELLMLIVAPPAHVKSLFVGSVFL